MAETIYTTNRAKYEVGASGEVIGTYINYDSDTFKLILLDSGYTFNVNDDYYDDISGDEVVEVGTYTAGGETLTGGTWTEDDVNDRAFIQFDDVSWNGFSGEVIGGIGVYCDTHDDHPLVGAITFDPNLVAPSGELFTIKNPSIEIT